jgi:ribosomal protein L37AE/L43A
MDNRKYMPHILLPESVIRNIMGKSNMMRDMTADKARDNPVCPRCERVALRDVGYTENRTAQCPHCGYKGKMEVTLSQYTGKKLYK